MRPLDPRLLRLSSHARFFVAACVLGGLLTAVLIVVQAYLLSWSIARGTLSFVVPLVLVVVGRALLAWLQEVLAHRASAGVKSTLRRSVMERSLESGPTSSRASTTTLLGSGLDALDGYFARYLPQLVLAVIVPVGLVVVLATNDLVSAATVALTVPLIPVFMVLVGLAARDRAKRRWLTLARLAHHFADVVGGLPTLRIFGRARPSADKVARVSDAYRRESLAGLRLAFLSSLVLELLAMISVALVAVGVGVRLVEGGLTLETALIALILAPEAYLPIRLVGQHYHASVDGLAAAEQAFALLEAEPGRSGEVAPGSASVSVTSLGVEGRVSGLSFELSPGSITALSGPSGVGKSTAIAVLLGFVRPSSGVVEVGGVDVREVDLREWRRSVAWVPQRPSLFVGTIADNVRLGRPDASDDDVRAALLAASAPELAPSREVGERGAGLSVGQIRRVAFARALVRGAPVLLLDEPTAGVDAAGEAAIARTLQELKDSGRAILVVSHHPALLSVADVTVELGVRAGQLVGA